MQKAQLWFWLLYLSTQLHTSQCEWPSLFVKLRIPLATTAYYTSLPKILEGILQKLKLCFSHVIFIHLDRADSQEWKKHEVLYLFYFREEPTLLDPNMY